MQYRLFLTASLCSGLRLDEPGGRGGGRRNNCASGGQLWTEDGPFADDTVTNLFNNRLRVGLNLKQPIHAWTNAFDQLAGRDGNDVSWSTGWSGWERG